MLLAFHAAAVYAFAAVPALLLFAAGLASGLSRAHAHARKIRGL